MRNNKFGYITLLSILVIGAVGVSIAVSLLLLGLSSSRTSFAREQGQQAKALANACAEDALGQIRKTAAFTGTVNLPLGLGSCTYTVVNTGGQTRAITAAGTVGAIIRKLVISTSQVTPVIIIASWQEG